MTYIHHITLNTGHTRRSDRSEVSGETIEALAPWITHALDYIDEAPLPGPLGVRDGYMAQLTRQDGALLCTISTLALGPLVTFGVARRSRHGADLWPMLVAQFGAADGLIKPEAPWCAAHLHQSYRLQRGMSAWVGDFERCVAWAWVERGATK